MNEQELERHLMAAVEIRSQLTDAGAFINQVAPSLAHDVIRAGLRVSASFQDMAAGQLKTRKETVRQDPSKYAPQLVSSRLVQVGHAKAAIWAWAQEDPTALNSFLGRISANEGQKGATAGDDRDDIFFFPGLVGLGASFLVQGSGKVPGFKVLLAMRVLDTQLRPHLDQWFSEAIHCGRLPDLQNLERITEHSGSLEKLHEGLHEAAVEIRSKDTAPSAETVAELSAALKEAREESLAIMRDVSGDLGESDETTRTPSVPDLKEALNLHELGKSVDTDLRKIIDAVITICHVNQEDFKPLDSVREAAEKMREFVEGGGIFTPEEGMSHPIICLHQLLSDPTLSESLADTIGQAFGMPLLAAASSGHLRLGKDSGKAEVSPEPEASEPEVPEPEVPEPEVSEPEVPEPEVPEPEVSEPEVVEKPSAGSVTATSDVEESVVDFDERSVSELASELLPFGAESSPEPLLRALVLKLVGAGDYAHAFHVARYATSWDDRSLPLWLLEALCLARELQGSAGPVATRYQQLVSDLTENWSFLDQGRLSHNRGIDFLVGAATLSPSAVAPSSLPVSLLDSVSLGTGLVQTYDLLQTVVRFSRNGIVLDRQILIRVSEHAEWESELRTLKARASEWVAKALKQRLLYHTATEVLHKWARPDGLIGRLLEVVKDDDDQRRGEVEEETKALRRPQDLHRLIDDACGKKVMYKARKQLERRVAEALCVIDGWVAYRAVEEEGPDEYRLQHARRLKNDLMPQLPLAIAEISELIASLDDPEERHGATALRREMRALLDLLDGTRSPKFPEPSVDAVFSDPLLLFPDVPVLQDGTLGGLMPAEVGRLVLDGIAKQDVDWLSAYDLRIELHDLVATARMLEIGSPDIVPVKEIARRKEERKTKIKESFDLLKRGVEETRNNVELAGMNGLFVESERAALSSDVDSAKRKLEENDEGHLRVVADTLTKIAAEIESKGDAGLERVQVRIRELHLDETTPFKSRIEAAVHAGDVLTATELIDQFQDGLPITEPETQDKDELSDFFPELLASLETKATESPEENGLQHIRTRGEVGPVSFAELSKEQAGRSADIMERWYRSARNHGDPVKKLVEKVFNLIGFNVLSSSTPQDRGSRAWSEVNTEPIRDRSSCPVPLFGSGAAGSASSLRARYRVLWVWGSITPQDVINAVGDTNVETPTFVFYMGILGVEARRAVARLSRERRRTFLIIDSAVLLYLASKAGTRMATMFSLTLPFTFLEPYVVTAGTVPPELFYGRQSERKQVTDQYGTNFIYGGRQLGKTALLLHTRQNFHRPADGKIAIYLQLQQEQIGLGRRPEEIWSILGESLKDAGVTITATTSQKAVVSGVKKWLDEGSGSRRILALLDEADGLFESDAQFKVVASIKGLMDATDRRFKVVFAGLHNVQRMTRLSNNPLAHLGEPIVIGPLYERGEWKEAKKLLVEPLRSLGYRFASPDLVIRVLARTNYYPSLLQLFGTQLLRHVTKPNVETFSPEDSPPFDLTLAHVDGAYQEGELRQRIRERFIWTLDLDPRYRLIAFALAYATLEGYLPSAGLSVRDIRTEALSWWSQGFGEDSSEEVFSALLDEMVGLRVLRETSKKSHYQLRNENVALLIGNRQEIETELLDSIERDPPATFQPAVYRRPLPDSGDQPVPRRSPLTNAQEGNLVALENGVSLICGCRAAGMDDVEDALSSVALATFTMLKRVRSREELHEELNRPIHKRGTGVNIALVPADVSWDIDWVADTCERLKGLRLGDNFLRVVFLADPKQALHLVENGTRTLDRVRDLGVSLMSLHPWDSAFRREWLRESLQIPLPDIDEHLTKFDSLAGRWPIPLEGLAQRLLKKSRSQWLAALDEFAIEERDVRADFGLDVIAWNSALSLLSVGETSVADLAEVAEVSISKVESMVRWLDLMGLVTASDRGWRPDPILKRLAP
jgi:hypothetical protein